MKIKPNTAIVSVAIALMTTFPAAATTTQDLTKCRAALTEKGHFSAGKHSLKFNYTKGNTRARTLHLRLKDKQQNKYYNVACHMSKRQVVELEVTPK